VTRVVVLGYVSLDHVIGLNRDIEAGLTSLVRRRHTRPEGRLGGCASYIATGLAAAGVDTGVVSFTGDDAAADVIDAAFAAAGVDTAGLARTLPATGVSWLPYSPSGASYCVYDPGGPLPERLEGAQRAACAQADWLVAAVGAPAPCREALAVARDATVLWAVKGDPGSLPSTLTHALAERAAVIVYSSDEAAFLASELGADWRLEIARADALVVETQGRAGVRYWVDGEERRLALGEPLPVFDTIGAGDRFCAGLLAALLDRGDVEAAIRAGAAAARELLRGRAGGTEDDRRAADAGTRVVPARDA
jgi:ribokinase